MKLKPEKMPRGSGRQFTAGKTEHSGQMWALGRSRASGLCARRGWGQGLRPLPSKTSGLLGWRGWQIRGQQPEEGMVTGTEGGKQRQGGTWRKAKEETSEEEQAQKGGRWERPAGAWHRQTPGPLPSVPFTPDELLPLTPVTPGSGE